MTQEQRDEILLNIQSEQQEMKAEIQEIKSEQQEMKAEIQEIKSEQQEMKAEIQEIRISGISRDTLLINMENILMQMKKDMDEGFKEIRNDISEIKFTLYEWEPILDYAQSQVTSHINKINSLNKKVDSNTKNIKELKQKMSLLKSKKTAIQ